MKKKLLTIMLSIFMVLASFPATIFAEGDLTVTYDANGATSGTVPVDSSKYTDGDQVTVLGNTGNLQKDGYVFNGWNTQDDGKGIHRQPGGDPFEIHANETLYAEWAQKHDVTVNVTPSGAGTASADPTSAGEGSHVSLNAFPNPGYRFKEWQTTSGTLDDIHNDLTMPNEDVTVTAVFVPIIEIQVTNNNGANGTIQVKFGDGEVKSCTANSTKLDIPEGATTVTFKAIPDGDFTLQDCTILVNNSDYDESKSYKASVEGDGYTYTLPNDGSQVVFKASFGEKLLDWNTISWGGGNVEVKNGQVIPEVIHVGSNSYTAPFNALTSEDSLKNNHVTYSSGDLFVAEGTTDDISIDFRFIPDYGYQVTDVKANEGGSLLESFESGTEISTFTFNYKLGTNVHFNVEFTSKKDIINAANSTVVNDASISNGGNAINSGNLMLEIKDNANPSDGLKYVVGEGAIAEYLDMELSQIVSKVGTNSDGENNWENKLTDLEGSIDVTLNIPELDPNSDYYLVREHENEDHTYTYDVIDDAIFNKDDKTVTFGTDKFSTYALVKNEFDDNKFTVEYDGVFYDGECHASIEADGSVIRDGGIREFTTNEEITFTLNPAEDRRDLEHIVEIEVFDGDDKTSNTKYRSDITEGNVIEIENNNTFKFTPNKDVSFIVRVWWSEYDAFGPNEGQYIIETNVSDGGGNISLSPESGENNNSVLNESQRKDCYSVDTNVTLSFTPFENKMLDFVVCNDQIYTLDPQGDEQSISSLWSEDNKCYQLTVKDAKEGDFFYVEAHFTDIPLETGQFAVEYDDRPNGDSHDASIVVDESDTLYNGDRKSFTASSKISFKLNPPEDRKEDTPIVEIQVFDATIDKPYDTIWRTDSLVDEEHRLDLNENKFSFTPVSDAPFIVRVWWSEYDFFGPGEDQFIIENNVIGDGTIEFLPGSVGGITYGESSMRKDCFYIGNNVIASLIPGENKILDYVVINDQSYRRVPNEGESPLSDIWNGVAGCYQLNIKGESPENFFYVEAHFIDNNLKIQTIADVLATVKDFPTNYDDGWKQNGRGSLYIADNQLKVSEYKTGDHYRCFDLDAAITKNGDDYTHIESAYGSLVFHMTDGILTSIDFSNDKYSYLNGTYAKQLTIADIIPEDFPTSFDTGWVNENGAQVFRDDDYPDGFPFLHFQKNGVGGEAYGFTGKVFKDGDNYTSGSISYGLITFVMNKGVLTNIKLESDNTQEPYISSELLGNYESAVTIKDILATIDDFPSSYSGSNWESENDARVYNYDSKLTFTKVTSTNPWIENTLAIDVNYIVTKKGNNYTFKMLEQDSSEDVVTFVMNDGRLENITASGNAFELFDIDGTYEPSTRVRYTITYLDKGGSAFSGTHEDDYPTSHIFGYNTALKGASKDNYVFDGWYTDQDCTDGNKVTVLGAEDYTADITLYAKFIEAEAAISNTFDGTVKYYVSLLDALDDAKSMDSVVLLRDINFTNSKDIYIDEFVFLDLNNHKLHTNGVVTNNGGIVLYNENADIIDYLLYNVPGAYGAGEELKLPNASNPDYIVPDGTFLTVDVETSPNCQEFEIVVFDGEFIWNADVKKGTYLSIRDLTLGGDIIAPTDSNDKDTLVEVTELKLNDDIAIGSNNEDDGNATLFIESYDSSSDGKHNRGTINPNGKTITLNKTGVLVVSNDVSFDESIIKPGVDGMVVDKVYDEANKTYEYTLKLDHHYTNDSFTIPYNYAGTIEFVTDADCSVVGDVTVKVDGKVLNDSKYDLSFASVHITLHNDYLRLLSAGKHTMTISVKGYKTISQDFYITGDKPHPRYVVPNTGVN